MSTVNEVRSQAMLLAPQDRAALARDLLLSLEDSEPDEDVEDALMSEVESRAEAVARGEIPLTDWREAVTRIRQTLAERRQM